MVAFATVGDLEARWRPLDSSEASTAAALLDDAAILIRAELPDIDDRITAGTLDAGIPMIISVRMVKRSMMVAASGFEGMSQLSETAGPFQHSASFANPAGDMYLTKADRKLLGIGGLRAFTIDLAPDASWPLLPFEGDDSWL